jgi:hypothetical protein
MKNFKPANFGGKTTNKKNNFVQSIVNMAKPLVLISLAVTLPSYAEDLNNVGTYTMSAALPLIPYNNLKYFFAGALCCSFSHAISVPFDVIKTKKQISKDIASLSIIEAFKKVVEDEGVSMLFKGNKFHMCLLSLFTH